jgi:hypothetical protein
VVGVPTGSRLEQRERGVDVPGGEQLGDVSAEQGARRAADEALGGRVDQPDRPGEVDRDRRQGRAGEDGGLETVVLDPAARAGVVRPVQRVTSCWPGSGCPKNGIRSKSSS